MVGNGHKVIGRSALDLVIRCNGMQSDFLTTPIAESVIPTLAAAGRKRIRRIRRMQVLLSKVNVLQGVGFAGTATGFSRCISGPSVANYLLATMDHVYEGAPRPEAPWRLRPEMPESTASDLHRL